MQNSGSEELKTLLGREFDILPVEGGFVVEYVNYTAPIKSLVGKTEEEAVTLLVDHLKNKVLNDTPK